MAVTCDRIESFWDEHSRVPFRVDELPEQKWRDCTTKDAWGRELRWLSDGVSRVRVWSLGRDGKPGGTGEDADMGMEFDGSRMQGDRVSRGPGLGMAPSWAARKSRGRD